MADKEPGKLRSDAEREARFSLIEQLFEDFHRSRRQVYFMNFVRGIFFGVGSVIGGTIVVAIVLGLLGLLVDIPGGVGDFIRYIVESVKQTQVN